jgi:PucR C-terminal helix-turn-helix domain/GGDEF-like domain/GAF domain
MSANARGSIAESASSAIDPDAPARRASSRFPAGEFAAEFDDNLDYGRLRAEYRRLAAEQAALRRVSALVARGVGPLEVFGAVAEEIRRCVPAVAAGLWRFETDGTITIVAVAAGPAMLAQYPVGTRIPLDSNTIAELVQRSGRSARIDDYDDVAGSMAARVRAAGVRAAVGVPISVDGRVWGSAAVGSAQAGPMPADTEARIGRFAELVAAAVVAGYRDEQRRQLLAEVSQRLSLVDALLEGRAFDDWRLREVAGYLRLPIDGPFVVVAAEVPIVGDEPLPEIESKLRSLDIFSAWRLLPDLQIGIVHVTSDRKLGMVVALLSRVTTVRMGVSAAFGDLRETPQALHVARVMLRGPIDSTSSVAVFDGSILATAAVSASDVMIKSVGAALDPFTDLPDGEREVLFETFRVWQEGDASVTAAAERLFCHPNTVRHRLRRIEQRTGRSLSRPRDLAELCLAFEVHRHRM